MVNHGDDAPNGAGQAVSSSCQNQTRLQDPPQGTDSGVSPPQPGTSLKAKLYLSPNLRPNESPKPKLPGGPALKPLSASPQVCLQHQA